MGRLLPPLPYPSGKPDPQTLPIAIQQYNALYLAQRAFLRAVVAGVEE